MFLFSDSYYIDWYYIFSKGSFDIIGMIIDIISVASFAATSREILLKPAFVGARLLMNNDLSISIINQQYN